jgi:hypothetical protein
VSGLYIETLEPTAVRDTVERCLVHAFDEDAVTAHAQRYSEERFAAALHQEARALLG